MTDRSVLPLMACAMFAAMAALLPILGPAQNDFSMFLLPWMDEIRAKGIASISGEFSAYAPPYIYFLNAAALLEPFVGTVAAIKLINLPFVIGGAFGIGALVAVFRPDLEKTSTAAALIAPSLLVNAFAWGQADAIYTCFLIWFVASVLRGEPTLGAVLFGLALSFKVQAMFVSPLLLYLLLSGQMRFRDMLLIPATYAAMMLPAALAGRPWLELLGVYYAQTQYMRGLSFNVPSPWVWLEFFGVPYRTGLVIGLGSGFVATVAIALAALRLERSPFTKLLIACLSAAVIPYVLPNMGARYFFVADMLTIALAFVQPRLWPVAALVQLGSLLAYLAYFTGIATAHLAFFPMTFGIALLARQCSGARRKAADIGRAGNARDGTNLVKPTVGAAVRSASGQSVDNG